LQKTKIQGN